MTDSHHGDLRCAVATSLSMSDGLEMHQASFLSRLLTSGTYVKPHSSVRTMVANGVQFSGRPHFTKGLHILWCHLWMIVLNFLLCSYGDVSVVLQISNILPIVSVCVIVTNFYFRIYSSC